MFCIGAHVCSADSIMFVISWSILLYFVSSVSFQPFSFAEVSISDTAYNNSLEVNRYLIVSRYFLLFLCNEVVVFLLLDVLCLLFCYGKGLSH